MGFLGFFLPNRLCLFCLSNNDFIFKQKMLYNVKGRYKNMMFDYITGLI